MSYPNECTGCRTLVYLKEYEGIYSENLKCSGMGEYPCPCIDCLVKVTCRQKDVCPQFEIIIKKINKTSALNCLNWNWGSVSLT
jgi:hypothetical protein